MVKRRNTMKQRVERAGAVNGVIGLLLKLSIIGFPIYLNAGINKYHHKWLVIDNT